MVSGTRIFLISKANHETLYQRLPWVIVWTTIVLCFLFLQLYLSHHLFKIVKAKAIFEINKEEIQIDSFNSNLSEENLDNKKVNKSKISNCPKNASLETRDTEFY